MLKFIIVGDIHWRGTNPRARTDHYVGALTLKLLEIEELSREHNAPVIQTGDIFNSPNTAWWVVGELIRILNYFNNPIITIPGNHDIFGSNLASVARTPYGLMQMIGEINDACRDGFVWQSCPGPPPWVRITGHGYTAETDTPAGANQFMAPELPAHRDQPTAKIHIVHANLMHSSPGHDMRHTLIDQVETNADVVISGHYHPGFGVHRREDGVLFVNPGALARTAASASDLTREVQVALLTVDKDGRCDAELVPLLSARPGHEVLSREHLDAAEEREERIADFLGLLAEEGAARFMEMQEIIEDISARDKLPEVVKKEALRRLSMAKEALGVQ
ncbi:MAG: DNA repair exonuclease [Firmicutes bacterium]|nr:DNA repair exonuclease [Bacillota bacterium]